MFTRDLYFLLVGIVALQRIAELRKSKRNERRIRAEGGREHAPGHFHLMKAVHIGWFVAAVAEVALLHRPFVPALAAVALLVFLVGQALRALSMRALGWRWSVRIFTVPNAKPVSTGIYRYVRHPNYLGVVLEMLALPLVHSAWLTALVGSALNAFVLALRVTKEEQALREAGSYTEDLGERPRFVPRPRLRPRALREGT